MSLRSWDIPQMPEVEALRDSITSGMFVNTKFWVFSKRSSRSGRVGEPKALFANGHVVRSHWGQRAIYPVGTFTGDKGPNTHWVHGENIEITVNM